MSRVVDCLRGRDDQDYPVIVLRILFELDSDSALNIEFAAREQMARFEGAFEPYVDIVACGTPTSSGISWTALMTREAPLPKGTSSERRSSQWT